MLETKKQHSLPFAKLSHHRMQVFSHVKMYIFHPFTIRMENCNYFSTTPEPFFPFCGTIVPKCLPCCRCKVSERTFLPPSHSPPIPRQTVTGLWIIILKRV